MIKHRIMSVATLLGGVIFTGHVVAQSPEVARRLDAKYDVVWPAVDGLIRVNKGGYRIPDSRMKSNGKYGYADTLGQVVVPPAYDDAAALEELCRRSDAVTYEFENVPGDLLVALEQKYNIKQGFRPLFDSQDRLREKSNACDHGLKTPAFMAVDDEESLHRAIARIGYPCVLKTRTLGYDGHGQAVLRGEADLAKARELLAVPCILEEFVPFDFEASVVLVSDGERVICFPVGRNIHKDGILDLCIVPAEMPDQVRERMVSQSKRFMRDCGYRGILAIEYFVKGDEVYFNEMAPRPHNSGHWTIEGSTTNQFRELCRYLLDMPLEEPQLKAPTVMKNILGQDLERAEALARENRPGVYVHIYGKTVSKPKRKMGHVTFVGVTGEEYAAKWADRFVK